MRAGRLRHRITVEQYVLGSPQQGPTGEAAGAWGTFATVWASIEPLRGRELFAAQANNSKVELRIRVRYLDGLTPDMRIVASGVIYSIVAVINPQLKDAEQQILCTTGVNEG